LLPRRPGEKDAVGSALELEIMAMIDTRDINRLMVERWVYE
jgi:hypothetical protein